MTPLTTTAPNCAPRKDAQAALVAATTKEIASRAAKAAAEWAARQ